MEIIFSGKPDLSWDHILYLEIHTSSQVLLLEWTEPCVAAWVEEMQYNFYPMWWQSWCKH